MKKVAILGAGNVGQAIAGELARRSYSVRLYSRWAAELEPLRAARVITLEGELSGEGSPELLTNDLSEAVSGAELILIAAPGFAHRYLSEGLAELLAADQIVVFQPGVFGSALEFGELRNQTGKPPLLIAETDTSLYTCRLRSPGVVHVGAVKQRVEVAALPAVQTDRVIEIVEPLFPGRLIPAGDVLSTGLSNCNPIYHCPPTILNFSSVEKGIEQSFMNLITPGIAAVIDAVDSERCAIGKALGLELPTYWKRLESIYGVAASFSPLVQMAAIRGRASFPAPRSARDRYLTEDIPYGLMPWASLGAELGVATPQMDALIVLAEALSKGEITKDGRTVQTLGLANLTGPQMRERVTIGVTPHWA
jgi:opine dehydrogenase